MSRQRLRIGSSILVLLTLDISLLASGDPKVVGSVLALSEDATATLDGAKAIESETVFSGSTLRLEQNGQVLMSVGRGSKLAFGVPVTATLAPDPTTARGIAWKTQGQIALGGDATEVSFERDSSGLTATLTRGNVMISHLANDETMLRVRCGDVTIFPASGVDTVAHVALLDDEVMVIATDGAVRVQTAEQSAEVPKGNVGILQRTRHPAGGREDLTLTSEGVLLAGLGLLACIGGNLWREDNWHPSPYYPRPGWHNFTCGII